MYDTVTHAFLFLGALLGLVVVIAFWILVIVIAYQEIKAVFQKSKDEDEEPKLWWEEDQ